MNKRLLLGILSFVLLFLVACGQGGGNQQADTGAATGGNNAAAATDQPADASADELDMLNLPWTTPYPETITITTVNREMGGLIFPGEDTHDDNIWTRLAAERLNIQLVNDWISAEYETTLNLAIAAGNLPDIFWVSNPQFRQVVQANLVADLTEAYDRLASDTLRRLQDADPTVLEAARIDGRLLGIPRLGFGNNVEQPIWMFLRYDWWRDLGAIVPQTMADLEYILHQMNDVYGARGMALDNTLGPLLRMAASWHAYPLNWVDTPNGIEHGGIQPEMRNALEHWARWYAEGLIAPEFAARDFDAMGQDIFNELHGAQPMWQWQGWAQGASNVRINGPDAWMRPFVIPTIDGEQLMIPIQFDNGGEIVVVNSNFAYPEAAIKLINLYVHMTIDAFPSEIDMDEFTLMTANDVVHWPSFRINNPLSEYQQMVEVQWALANDRDTSRFTIPMGLAKFTELIRWFDYADPDGLGPAVQLGFPEYSAYVLAAPFFHNDWFMRCMMWGPAPDAHLRLGGLLNSMLLEGYTQIIMGIQPIEYFDTLVANWRAAGGDEVTAAVNEEFGR